MMMAGCVIITANQLCGAKTGLFGGVQPSVNIRQEQNGRGRQPKLRGDITVGLHLPLRTHQRIEVTAEQMSNITFVAVAK